MIDIRTCAIWVVCALLPQLADAAPAADEVDKDGTEIGVLPVVGGDTDHGFGAGAIGSIANFEGTSYPYRWRLEFAAFLAVKGSVTNISHADAFVKLVIPQLLGGRLRLEVRPSFTRESGLRIVIPPVEEMRLGHFKLKNMRVTSKTADDWQE